VQSRQNAREIIWNWSYSRYAFTEGVLHDRGRVLCLCSNGLVLDPLFRKSFCVVLGTAEYGAILCVLYEEDDP
jgi:hypothetical protein